MVPILALDALCKRIEKITGNLQLEVEGKGEAEKIPPQVVGGWLEKKDPRNQERMPDVPYIAVRYSGHADEEESESSIKLHVHVATHSPRPDGWRDVANVIEMIRQDLLKHRILDNRFPLKFPIKSDIPTDDQPYPDWVGMMEVQFRIPQPVEEVIFDNG